MAFNFNDDAGFDDTGADDLVVKTLDGGSYALTGDVKFAEHGVYGNTAGAGLGTGLLFIPWSYIKYVTQTH
jgi:hypothetical protein